MPPPRFREFLACFRKGSTHLAPVSPVSEPPECCGGLHNTGARRCCSDKPDQGRDQPQTQCQPRTRRRPDCIAPSPAVCDGRFRRHRGGEPLPGARRLREAFLPPRVQMPQPLSAFPGAPLRASSAPVPVRFPAAASSPCRWGRTRRRPRRPSANPIMSAMTLPLRGRSGWQVSCAGRDEGMSVHGLCR